MQSPILSGGIALTTLVASFMSWGSLTAPISTPGLLHGAIHTFRLSGWNGTVLVPFWVDVLAAMGAAILFGISRNRAAMLLAVVVVIHLTIAASVLVTDDASSIGPGLATTALAAGVLAFHALKSFRTGTS